MSRSQSGAAGPSGYVPSWAPFHNVETKPREQRLAGRSKELLEKERLRARGVAVVDNPIAVMPQAPNFADEYQRFGAAKAAALEQERRVRTQAQKQDVYERKRAENHARERERWSVQEQQHKLHEDFLASKREGGQGGSKRNGSSEHYDIISLTYQQGAQGEALKTKDASIVNKANMRAANLYSKQHSVSHNIITGHPLPFAPAVAPPAPSQRPF